MRGEGAAAASVAARSAARVGGLRLRVRRGAALEIDELGGDRHAEMGKGTGGVGATEADVANCGSSSVSLTFSLLL